MTVDKRKSSHHIGAVKDDATEQRNRDNAALMATKPALMKEVATILQQPRIELRGGTKLTLEECKAALDDAMQIIEAVGTTGIYSRYQAAHKWMKTYYPAYD